MFDFQRTWATDFVTSMNSRVAIPKQFFLTAIWLPHGQLWAIIKQPHSPDVNYCVLHFDPKVGSCWIVILFSRSAHNFSYMAEGNVYG